MRMKRWVLATLMPVAMMLMITPSDAQVGVSPATAADAYLWLEGQYDPVAVAWAKERTQEASALLASSPAFQAVLTESRQVQQSIGTIPSYSFLGDHVVRYVRNTEYPNGRLELAERGPDGLAAGPWKTVFDMAEFNKREGSDFEFIFLNLASQCLPPLYRRCLLPLSPGGSSNVEYREFDLMAGKFVKDGFRIPLNRSQVAWLNRDTLLVGHSLYDSPTSPSGYAAVVRRWERGTPLQEAKPVFEAAPTDSVVLINAVGVGEGRRGIITLMKDYATVETYTVDHAGKVVDTGLPTKLKYLGIPALAAQRYLVVQLAEPAEVEGVRYEEETLIAYDLAAPAGTRRTNLVMAPAAGTFVNRRLVGTPSGLKLIQTRNLKDTLVTLTPTAQGWSATDIISAPQGVAMSITASDTAGNVVVHEVGYLQPARLSLLRPDNTRVEIQSNKPVIDAAKFVSEIRSARSKDGTLVDYYLIRPRHRGSEPVPTIIEAYGAFGLSMDPSYFTGGLGSSIPSWLERGGAFAIAAVRGGGERGAAWHRAAIGANKQRTFDDVAAVAEGLIHDGFTVPGKIGVYGRSAGGLLAATMATQRPELFGAALVGAPIIDLFRMGKGDSGIGGGMKAELGDWDDPDEIPHLLAYSPYQNIRAGVTYPRILTIVATSDNQVGPGHARKFTAKLQAAGADALLIEGATGGHNFPNPYSEPEKFAMQMAFFIDTLMPAPDTSNPKEKSTAASTSVR